MDNELNLLAPSISNVRQLEKNEENVWGGSYNENLKQIECLLRSPASDGFFNIGQTHTLIQESKSDKNGSIRKLIEIFNPHKSIGGGGTLDCNIPPELGGSEGTGIGIKL